MGVWAHIGFVDQDLLGFLIKRCSFEEQIEKIQIVRSQLDLGSNEKIYFRTHRNFIENHEWLGFRGGEEEKRPETEDPFIRETDVQRYFFIKKCFILLYHIFDIMMVYFDSFRYLRAAFEDDTLNPGEVPELIAESK